MRALVTISYAHWEGYIKFAAKKYLEHIALRKFQFNQLDRQFLRNYFLPRLAVFSGSKNTVSERCAIIDEILSSLDKRFSYVNEDIINTKSNLNSEVFFDICTVCSVSTVVFESKSNFIDIVLLKRRNSIAHGEDTFIGVDDLDTIADETIALMRSFGDALENQAYLQAYKSA